MAEYIDREELRKRMFSYYGCVNEKTSKRNYNGETLMAYEVADMIDDCLDNAPVSDVAPVVRCKDCKFFIVEDWQGELLNHCQNSDGMVEPYPHGFCCYGERKVMPDENDGFLCGWELPV